MKIVNDFLDKAGKASKEYMYLYSEIMPDRGAEGQITSYNETVPPFIEAVAAHFSGKYEIDTRKTYDGPPIPDESVK